MAAREYLLGDFTVADGYLTPWRDGTAPLKLDIAAFGSQVGKGYDEAGALESAPVRALRRTPGLRHDPFVGMGTRPGNRRAGFLGLTPQTRG